MWIPMIRSKSSGGMLGVWGLRIGEQGTCVNNDFDIGGIVTMWRRNISAQRELRLQRRDGGVVTGQDVTIKHCGKGVTHASTRSAPSSFAAAS